MYELLLLGGISDRKAPGSALKKAPEININLIESHLGPDHMVAKFLISRGQTSNKNLGVIHERNFLLLLQRIKMSPGISITRQFTNQ